MSQISEQNVLPVPHDLSRIIPIINANTGAKGRLILCVQDHGAGNAKYLRADSRSKPLPAKAGRFESD